MDKRYPFTKKPPGRFSESEWVRRQRLKRYTRYIDLSELERQTYPTVREKDANG